MMRPANLPPRYASAGAMEDDCLDSWYAAPRRGRRKQTSSRLRGTYLQIANSVRCAPPVLWMMHPITFERSAGVFVLTCMTGERTKCSTGNGRLGQTVGNLLVITERALCCVWPRNVPPFAHVNKSEPCLAV
jgi:hypothetical protein